MNFSAAYASLKSRRSSYRPLPLICDPTPEEWARTMQEYYHRQAKNNALRNVTVKLHGPTLQAATRFATIESLTGRYKYDTEPALDALKNRGLRADSVCSLQKCLVCWEMRLGMATQIIRGKPLTERQKTWLKTNWQKGVADFEKTFTSHCERTIAIKRLQTIVERIKAAIEMKVLRKQNDR